mmetsp:Transcript_19714/g.45797  ORF Transcript_19714/g.45797 Transcript_19714/m.45797 type:complete len:88 (-) Transcript_19714:977-1240(-)
MSTGNIRVDTDALSNVDTDPWIDAGMQLKQLWPCRSSKLTQTASPTCAKIARVYGMAFFDALVAAGFLAQDGKLCAMRVGRTSLPVW